MLKVSNVSFAYDNHQVLENINLNVKSKEIVSVLGTSGVGKTTLFNLISQTLQPQTGMIQIDGSSNVKEHISYMLQKDLLFEHKSVLENIMLPMIIQGDSQAKEKALSLLEQVNLEKWANFYPKALSGGMRQRIGFLRTAAMDREWILLDEAFSALDARTRRKMQKWFIDYKNQRNWSTLLITHDIEEAILLSDRIYVLSGQPGRIILELSIKLPKMDADEIIFDKDFLSYKRELLVSINKTN